MSKTETTPDLVKKTYGTINANITAVRKILNRPLTLAEKLLFGHLADPETQDLVREESFLLRTETLSNQRMNLPLL